MEGGTTCFYFQWGEVQPTVSLFPMEGGTTYFLFPMERGTTHFLFPMEEGTIYS